MARYSFQDDGGVLMGTTPLVNITEANVEFGGSLAYTDVTVAGDTQAQELQGIVPAGRVKITLKVYDESGAAGDGELKDLLVGDAGTTNQTLKLRLEGTGAGLPEQIWPNMSLTNKNLTAPAGVARPPVSGTITFEGRATTEPAWTAQS